jgi:RNA polymerase sigma factor (TIGR02999 family)
MSEVTRLLEALRLGNHEDSDRLFQLIYDELREMAARRLRSEPADFSMSATGLVHEAYLRLVPEDGAGPSWVSRRHFFGAASEAMRRILVDAARQRNSWKRGGHMERRTGDPDLIPAPTNDEELLAVHEALDGLAKVDPEAAEVVKLRFFSGMTMEQIANVLQVSVRTAHNLWTYARAWLRKEIHQD